MIELLSKIKINPLFWMVLGLGVLTGYFKEVLMVFLIVFIHEMGHASAAYFFKWRIKKIELLPFGGVAEVEDAGNRPFYEEIFIIIAGPIQHIWLIGASYLLIGLPFWTINDHNVFLWHNLIILSFNLIPILPLDGGRILQLTCMYFFPYVKALRVSWMISVATLVVLICLSIVLFPYHLNLWVVLSFLVITNYLEWKQRHYRFIRFLHARLSLNNTKSLKATLLAVRDSVPLREVVKLCRRGQVHQFKIVQAQRGHYFIIDEKELLGLLFSNRQPQAPLSQFSFTDVQRTK